MVDADLSKYFDTIPHSELIKSVARRVVDRNVLRLIKMWLRAPIEERDADGTRRMSGGKRNTRGTPQKITLRWRSGHGTIGDAGRLSTRRGVWEGD